MVVLCEMFVTAACLLHLFVNPVYTGPINQRKD